MYGLLHVGLWSYYPRWHVFYIETVPQRNVKSMSCQVQMISLHAALLEGNHLQRRHKRLFLSSICCVTKDICWNGSCDWLSGSPVSHVPFISADQGYSERKMVVERASSHNCFVTGCDSCCFDLFSPHRFDFIFYLPLKFESILRHCGFILTLRSHCDTSQADSRGLDA